MTFTLEPAVLFAAQLNQLVMKATFDIANEWFFYDGAHNGANCFEQNLSNTWLHENFVAVSEDKEIIAYFEGQWQRPVDVINAFRTIHFGERHALMATKAFFSYLDYLFINRGCNAFNWTVAHKNEHAMRQYERFINNYCGRRVGMRHHGQKSYSGKISDINLYEITRDQYLEWKEKRYGKRNGQSTGSEIEVRSLITTAL